MGDLAKAERIQATIRGIMGASASGLVSVPTKNATQSVAVRKLQIMIFELADALAEVTAEVDELKRSRRR